MVARLLHICGLDLGPEKDLMPAQADNPAGFWENVPAVDINDAVLENLGGGWDYPRPTFWPGWERSPSLDVLREKARRLVASFGNPSPVINPVANPDIVPPELVPTGREAAATGGPRRRRHGEPDSGHWGLKDPRFALTLPFWQPLLPDPFVVICLRHPLAVAHSLMMRRGQSPALALHLWQEHYGQLLAATQPDQRMVTPYDTYFPDPRPELLRLLAALDWSVPEETLSRACATVSGELRHSQASSNEVAHIKLPDEVVALYRDLLAEAGREQPGGGPDVSSGGFVAPPAKADDPAAAKARLLDILDRNPNDIAAQRSLADNLIQQGHYDDGVNLLLAIIREHPQDWEAHLMMAGLYDEVGRADEVLQHVRAVLVIKPDQDAAGQLLAKYSKEN